MPATLHSSTPGWQAETAATLRLAGPLALANLLQMLVYAIDVIFVARLGTVPLAAVSLSVALFGTFAWALSGLTGMVAALIAAALGRGTGVLREVRRATRMALWLAIGAGLLLALLCQLGEGIMLLAGQDAVVAVQAGEFLALLGWAAVPILLANVLRSYVAALGRPMFATLVLLLAVLVAALGNYALVFGNLGFAAMGIKGAALASNITSWIMVFAFAALILCDRKLARFRVFGRWWSPDWPQLRRLIAIGTPVALTVLAEAAVFNSAAFMVGLFGPEQLAGHTLALQIAAFAFQVPFGVSQAATIRVGYHYGAGDHRGIARAGWVAILIGTGFMGLTALLMLLVPELLLTLYLDPQAGANAVTVRFAVSFLVIAAAFQLFDGLQAVTAGALRGLQDTRVPLLIALLSYWGPGFAAMVGLGFALRLEGVGVWIGLLIGLVAVSAGLLWRWHRRAALGLLPG